MNFYSVFGTAKGGAPSSSNQVQNTLTEARTGLRSSSIVFSAHKYLEASSATDQRSWWRAALFFSKQEGVLDINDSSVDRIVKAVNRFLRLSYSDLFDEWRSLLGHVSL